MENGNNELEFEIEFEDDTNTQTGADAGKDKGTEGAGGSDDGSNADYEALVNDSTVDTTSTDGDDDEDLKDDPTDDDKIRKQKNELRRLRRLARKSEDRYAELESTVSEMRENQARLQISAAENALSGMDNDLKRAREAKNRAIADVNLKGRMELLAAAEALITELEPKRATLSAAIDHEKKQIGNPGTAQARLNFSRWKSENDWWRDNQSNEASRKAAAISAQLVAENVPTSSPHHFKMLNEQMKKAMPALFKKTPGPAKKPTVASGNNNGGGGSGSAVSSKPKIKLKQVELDIYKEITGVDPRSSNEAMKRYLASREKAESGRGRPKS